jgi:hypothetical protein
LARSRRASLPHFGSYPGSDRGSVGLAQFVGPYVMETAATGDVAIGREEVERLRYDDCHLVDRMHRACQISDRQYDSAMARYGEAMTGTVARVGP